MILYLILTFTHSFTIDNQKLIWEHSYDSDYNIESLELAVNMSSDIYEVKRIGDTIIGSFESPDRIYSGMKYPFFTQSKIKGKAVFSISENGYNVTIKGLKYTQPELNITDDPLEKVALKKGNYRKQFIKFVEGYELTLINITKL